MNAKVINTVEVKEVGTINMENIWIRCLKQ